MTSFTSRISYSFGSLLLVLSVTLAGWSCTEGKPSPSEHLVQSVLWFQTSAEMRAISYQTFALAKMRLDLEPPQRRWAKKRAVVLDIDETVLDNSPHSAALILEGRSFPYAWTEWVDAARAEALPGALDFLNEAVSKGYDVFYVSNRSAATELKGTIANLLAKGFPQAEESHVLLMGEESGKEGRRKTVESTHDIALLIGDNLNDLSDVFERKSIADRSAEVDKLKAEFGSRFIVMPNPMYGAWESAAYEYGRNLSDERKSGMRRGALRPFKQAERDTLN